MRVEVYRNLHRGDWSIRSCTTGRVIGHSDQVFLADVRLTVQKAGRDRVLREKRKNVHAFMRGELVTTADWHTSHNTDQQVSYNPYKAGSFILKATGEPVTQATRVTLTASGQAFIGN
jgi:hypothetical protein